MKTILYLGLDPPIAQQNVKIIHYPVIRVVPRSPENLDICDAFKLLPTYSHFLFTSKNGLHLFFEYLPFFHDHLELKGKIFIAVGKKTASLLFQKDFTVLVPKEETAEGVIKIFQEKQWSNSLVLWPHSALSRPLLKTFFQESKISFKECILYDTIVNQPEPFPDINQIHEIVFTSPSTVDAFLQLFGTIPEGKIVTSIGPITQKKLESHLNPSL